MRAGAPQLADAYLDAYAKAAAIERERITAWLPVIAGARVVENVPEELEALVGMADFA